MDRICKKDDGKEGGSQRSATSRLTPEDHLHANCVSPVRKYEGHMFPSTSDPLTAHRPARLLRLATLARWYLANVLKSMWLIYLLCN